MVSRQCRDSSRIEDLIPTSPTGLHGRIAIATHENQFGMIDAAPHAIIDACAREARLPAIHPKLRNV
jgi:hypothetical protein